MQPARTRGTGEQPGWMASSSEGEFTAAFKNLMLSKHCSGCCEGSRLQGGGSGSRRGVRRLSSVQVRDGGGLDERPWGWVRRQREARQAGLADGLCMGKGTKDDKRAYVLNWGESGAL